MPSDVLELRHRVFGPGDVAVMAIVNRTPDSFFDAGATFDADAAMARVARAVHEGADLVDIGGVKAGVGPAVSVAEEIRRTAPFVARVRASFPELPISVDTYRAEVARVVVQAGADLLNDAWGGVEPELAEVAAQAGVGLVCTHTGGLAPRTEAVRATYDDVVADVIETCRRLASRAEALGVRPERILVDPGHDFGKTTQHSLEVTRRLTELVEIGWPVLVALSNKDFVGETLDRGVLDRLPGTLAATAIAVWQGARVVRAHQVGPTREVVDMVRSIRGARPPAAPRRGLG